MTNGDKIRRLSDTELAEFLCKTTECARCAVATRCRWLSSGVESGWRAWMQEEAKDAEQGFSD